jgi:hypothetical protein
MLFHFHFSSVGEIPTIYLYYIFVSFFFPVGVTEEGYEVDSIS